MRVRRLSRATLLTIGLVLSTLPAGALGQDSTPVATRLPDGVTVIASGLTNPRGFTWDVNGELYVALAGVGGATPGMVEEMPTGIMGGLTASIARVDDGCATPVVTGLPSGLWTEPGWIWGVADLAFLNGQLYALIAGGGSDFGNVDTPNGVYHIDPKGDAELVADLSAWFREHPVDHIPWDYNEDGSLFDMEAGDNRLWISEAVGGRLLTVTAAGEITLIADLSEDHMVPTGVALRSDGGAYVGHETVVPFPDGASTVIAVAADGIVSEQWTGLTAVTDVVLSPDGVMYAAEMATGNVDAAPYLRPQTGRVVRQTGPNTLEAVVTDITYPVMLGFGPDGALYLTYPAFGPDAGRGLGGLLRIDLAATPVSLAGVGTLPASCSGGSTATIADATPASAPGVTMIDFAFAPAALEVAAGTTVYWTNQDWPPHTVTADDGSFDSRRLDAGQTFGHTFETPGEYTYHCVFQPLMVGSVTVR